MEPFPPLHLLPLTPNILGLKESMQAQPRAFTTREVDKASPHLTLPSLPGPDQGPESGQPLSFNTF